MTTPVIVAERLDSNGNAAAIWSCGCVTFTIKDKFYILPCKNLSCPVFGEVIKQTRERGHKLEVKLV